MKSKNFGGFIVEAESGPCRRCYSSICSGFNYLQSPLLLVIRLVLGAGFFFAGLGKWQNMEKTASFFASLDLPWPLVNAYLVGSIELLGGIFLFLGLYSRIWAFFLSIIMIVAYSTAHYDALAQIAKDPALVTEEAPFLYLYSSLIILAFGPGFFSLGRLFCKKREKN